MGKQAKEEGKFTNAFVTEINGKMAYLPKYKGNLTTGERQTLSLILNHFSYLGIQCLFFFFCFSARVCPAQSCSCIMMRNTLKSFWCCWKGFVLRMAVLISRAASVGTKAFRVGSKGINTSGSGFFYVVTEPWMRISCSFQDFCLAVEHVLEISNLNLCFWIKSIREIELLQAKERQQWLLDFEELYLCRKKF